MHELAMEKVGRMLEPLEHPGTLRFLAKMRHVNRGVTEVWRDLDLSDRHKTLADARVFHLAQQELAYLFSQQFVHSDCSPGHRCAPIRSSEARMLVRPLFVEELDDIAFEKLVEPAEYDAALIAGCDLSHVVGEALKPFAARTSDFLTLAQDADHRATPEGAVGDEAACNLAESARLEDLPHFRVA